MKVYISADIEGIASTATWDDCSKGTAEYEKARQQMTREVLAACEGAFAAGADEILIKDAHGPGTNIDIYQMPENVRLIRRWSQHPYVMAEGIDETFDAAMFIGYHSAAGKDGNFLAHTLSKKPAYVKINGEYASEFMIYSWAAAYEGVPTVFLSGDKQLCEESADLHPNLVTAAVKEGDYESAICMSPAEAVKNIRKGAEAALRQNLRDALIELPPYFEVEIRYKEHADSAKPSFYPGVVRKDSHTIFYETDNYFDVLTLLNFVL
ncbi:MAG: M55 family metallopeptidase [Firmicutes bacterium]|nr:M55 family metallopeptidase [Bacillota bacterium]